MSLPTEKISEWQTLKNFWAFIEPRKKPLRMVYFLFFLNSMLNILPAFSLRFYIDLVLIRKEVEFAGITFPTVGETTSSKMAASLIFLAATLLLLLLANTIGVVMHRRSVQNIEAIILQLKLAIHNHINKLSLGYFAANQVGDVMTKAVSDVDNLGQMMRSSFHLTYMLILILLIPVVMVMQSPLLSLIAFLPVPVIVYCFWYLRKNLKPMYTRQRQSVSKISSQIQESISGIKEIKAFNLEDYMMVSYEQINRRFYKIQNRIMKVWSLNHQIVYGSKDAGRALIVIVGGMCMFYGIGGMTVGMITSFIVLAGMLYEPVASLVGLLGIYQSGLASLERILGFLQIKPDVQDKPDAKVLLQAVKGKLKFTDVSFWYTHQSQVLRSINFECQAGEKIGVVGPSGSGKSTLLSLIPRFYDVTSGSIEIDGINITDVTQESLRKNIGIVFQETFLFYGTIRDNLTFISPDKSEEELIDACNRANIYETIMGLCDGFDTKIGERGVKLSGGQKQRLAIARVLLKDPPIVLLDEATSALDTETERLIQDSMSNMLKGRTAFIIAHRLSTIDDCDRILVLNNGTIEEIGTHIELIEKRGKYFQMNMQKG